jgi:hypothetical protein
VLTTLPHQHASCRFELADQIDPLHPIVSSAILRMPGMSPLSVLQRDPEDFPEVRLRFALHDVIWEFLEIAEPHIAVLPMDVAGGGHAIRLVAGACLEAIHNALAVSLVRRWPLPKNGTGPAKT